MASYRFLPGDSGVSLSVDGFVGDHVSGRRPLIRSGEGQQIHSAYIVRLRGLESLLKSLGGLKETKMFLPHPRVKGSIVGSLRDREVACSASDRQGANLESCVWRRVSSHHPQEVLLAQFSLYVHKGGLKPDSFHFTKVNHSREGRFHFLVHIVK